MKWVSVRDQLPPESTEVLFVTGKNEVSVGRVMDYKKGEETFATSDSIYFVDSLDLCFGTCKFWMHLPKPPGE